MRQDEAYWLGGKGNGLCRRVGTTRGSSHHRASLTIYEDVGAQAELLEALHDMGRLHLLLGDPDSAERDFTRALELAREIGLSRGITQNLIALGDLQFRAEDLEAAAEALRRGTTALGGRSKEQHLSPKACCGSRSCIANREAVTGRRGRNQTGR